MREQFVPYEIALKLKELGFDGLCLTKYGMASLRIYENYKPYRNSEDRYNGGSFCNDLCAAPLWQQAFDWFRDKHNLFSYIDRVYEKAFFDYEYLIGHIVTGGHETYEQARLACLEELIKTIKTKQSCTT